MMMMMMMMMMKILIIIIIIIMIIIIIIIISCFVERPFLTDRQAVSTLQKHTHMHFNKQLSLASILPQARHSFITSGRGSMKRLEGQKVGV